MVATLRSPDTASVVNSAEGQLAGEAERLGGRAWQRELGCLATPPGDYRRAVSIVPAADGGYVVGGGTVGCGSGNNCAALSGVQCALVEKVSADRRRGVGARVQRRRHRERDRKIRQTSDGGYIAAGTINDANQNPGGLILKLDGRGAVRWQRQLGPAGSTEVLLHDVRQTSDDGYVVTGYIENPRAPDASASVLVVRLDASGNVIWQRSFKGPSGPGELDCSHRLFDHPERGRRLPRQRSLGQRSGAETCCSGALLLKLDSAGNIRWQNALSGGLYCFFNGFNETCTNLAGSSTRPSRQPTAATCSPATRPETERRRPIEPWLAKVDSAASSSGSTSTTRPTIHGQAAQRVLRRLGRGERRRLRLARLHRERHDGTRGAVGSRPTAPGSRAQVAPTCTPAPRSTQSTHR